MFGASPLRSSKNKHTNMSWKCKHCGELNDEEIHINCWKCKEPRYEQCSSNLESSFVCSTTPQIPGRIITESVGIVFGDAIVGASIMKDFVAGFKDAVGGRSKTYESQLKISRNIAITDMIQVAKNLGADAIIGVDIDYETMGQSLMVVCSSGTAVKLEQS